MAPADGIAGRQRRSSSSSVGDDSGAGGGGSSLSSDDDADAQMPVKATTGRSEGRSARMLHVLSLYMLCICCALMVWQDGKRGRC